MAPRTRSSAKNVKKSGDNHEEVISQKQSKPAAPKNASASGCFQNNIEASIEDDDSEIVFPTDVSKKTVELDISDDDDETNSNSNSMCSSSAEDSDDDFEKEMSKHGTLKKLCIDGSSEDEEIVRDIEKKIEQEIKRKRIRKKENRLLEGKAEDNEDIVCEFESNDVSKQRRRRLYRRRMMTTTTTGAAKRRRIKRPDMDMADDYTCDTLVQFGMTSKTLTTDFDWDDPDIDGKAAKRLFNVLESEDEFSDQSEEDEADIIGHNLQLYLSRNSTERVSQVIELNVAPFSEKLACYSSSKAVHGTTRSSIQCQHPSFLIKQDSKLPEELVWERPFITTLHMPAQFDAHEECNKFLNDIETEKKQETEYKLLREIEQRVNEKVSASKPSSSYVHEKFYDSEHVPSIDNDFDDFSIDNVVCFDEPDIRNDDDLTFF